jgi:hypothetical protein
MSWDCHNLGGKVNFCARQADLLWEKKAEKMPAAQEVLQPSRI